MNKLLFFFLGIFITYPQQTPTDSLRLSQTEIDSIFTSDIKSKFTIDFQVYRAYAYDDTKGEHLILMTEHPTPKTGDTFQKEHLTTYNDSIKVYFFDIKKATLKLKRTLTDFIIQRDYQPEYSIEHWTKFFELDDYDGNGTIDPILIYGTYSMNGTDDGRIKIIVLQNNKKIAIRHQNGIMDSERNSTIDAEFYKLPTKIQQQVIKQMNAIEENGSGIFPYGWQDAMQRQELEIWQ